MLRNYLKVILRILTRNKLYSFISVGGLAVGFACCTLLLLYVRHELSYDRYHEDVDSIYRVAVHYKFQDREGRMSTSPAALAPLLRQENPQVLAAARLKSVSDEKVALRYKDRSFLEHRFWWAEQDVFDVVSIPIISGDRNATLARPNTVAISESMAKKYFRDENPIGKTMIMNSAQNLEVTAVYRDQPSNSHLQFDFLASLQIRKEFPFSWTHFEYLTYLKIMPNGNPEVLADEINRAVQSSKGGELLRQVGGSFEYFLKKVPDIHLYSDLDDEIELGADVTHVYVYSLIATFILVIAAVNFVNLTLSMAGKRSKELEVRRAAGAQRRQLAQQLIGESVVLSLFGALFALILIDLSLPWFNGVTGKKIEVDYVNDPSILIGFLAIALLTGLLAAIYPAILQSRFHSDGGPGRGAVFGKKRGSLRNTLIVAQFAISSALILGTLGLSRQLDYLQSKHLGFEKANLLFVSMRSEILRRNFEPLKEKWLQYPDVIGVTRCSELPGLVENLHRIKSKGETDEEAMVVTGLWVDFDFFETLGAEILQGRAFSPDFPNDLVSGCLINESTAKLMGGKSKAVGQKLDDDGLEDTEVIGVVADFHFQSLRFDIRPLMIYMKDNRVVNTSELPKVLIRVSDGDLRRTIELLESDWHEIDPNAPFEIGFLDQRTHSLYRSDLQLSRIFGSFAIVALLLASLGLFAVTAVVTEHRTKEIGIRKAVGASLSDLVFRLSGPFLKLVMLANAVAWPIAYYWLRQWYDEFAYRTNIDFEMFLMTGLVSSLIAFGAIAFRAVKTALANPIDALRYE